MFLPGGFFVPALLLFAIAVHAEELPDLSTVAPDLTVPEMTTGAPEAGKRVRFTTAGWEATEVYGALYLPVDWKPAGRFPVIVEWAGNGDFHNAFGDVSTGKVEGSRLGYGITAGGALHLGLRAVSQSRGDGECDQMVGRRARLRPGADAGLWPRDGARGVREIRRGCGARGAGGVFARGRSRPIISGCTTTRPRDYGARLFVTVSTMACGRPGHIRARTRRRHWRGCSG
ncbi:MAG: hypothetical protein WDN28_00475 [Chthoniobacter sp.]